VGAKKGIKMKFTNGGSIEDLSIGNCGVEFEKFDTAEEIMKVMNCVGRPMVKEEAEAMIRSMRETTS
jgi:hypothetical protein